MEYNFIYDRLVRDENDLHGLIAYGIYKRHKKSFIEQFKDEKHVSEVSNEDLKTFHVASNVPSQISAYYLQAQKLMADTVGQVMQDEIELARIDVRTDFQGELKQALPKWWQTIVVSILCSIVASAITALILMFVSFKTNFDDKVDKIDKAEHHIESVEQHVEQMVSSLEETGKN